MKLSRRAFFKLAGIGGVAALSPRILYAGQDATDNDDDVLVVIYLRGAADGLNIVPPYADADYTRLRPGLAIPSPDPENPEAALDLDGFFGLHPAMGSLLPIYRQGDLAVIHAVGSPDPSHSHFTAQNRMEHGEVDASTLFSGWLGRYLQYSADADDSVFRRIGMGNSAPISLNTDLPAIAMTSLEEFGLRVPEGQEQELQAMLLAIYDRQDLLDRQSRITLDAVTALAQADPGQYPVENGADYPDTRFGQQLMETGQMIRAGIGLQAVAIDIGGWDTHEGQAATLNTLAAELAQGLAAFHTDMGERMSGITLITMTEFGRRAYENGSGGTDHGHGSFMLAMGANVNGGLVYHDWPGLTPERLYNDGDLAVTTDYRTILAELISRRTRGMPLQELFPGDYPTDFLGVFRG